MSDAESRRDRLDDLADTTLNILLARLKSGEATHQDINQARLLLSQAGIEFTKESKPAAGRLAAKLQNLPFPLTGTDAD